MYAIFTYISSDIVSKPFQAVAVRALELLDSLDSDDVTRIVWAFGELGVHEDAFFEEVADR